MSTLQLINKENLIAKRDELKDAVLIDIRSPSEYAREHISGSINIPLEDLKSMDEERFVDKTLIFYCKSGNRTKQAQTTLNRIKSKQQFCLEKGIEQWKDCGLPIDVNKKAPLELMRQVQIIAGLLILLGVVGGYLISPYFIWLTVLAGVGMLIAGVTGFCGMANLLMLLPYNKTKH